MILAIGHEAKDGFSPFPSSTHVQISNPVILHRLESGGMPTPTTSTITSRADNVHSPSFAAIFTWFFYVNTRIFF
jgi:hypothetical protein